MTAGSSPEETRRFDLSELVHWELQKNIARARVQAWAVTAFGLVIAGVGVYIGFIQSKSPTIADFGEGSVVVATGLVVALAGWIYPRALQRKPNLLIVADDSLSYGRSEKPPLKELLWDNPRIKLVLHDRRNLRAKLQKRDRFGLFSIIPDGNTRIPLTQEAFDTVMTQAQRHGLGMKRQDLGSVGVIVLKKPRNGSR